jgi:hypothetical protein
MRMELVSASVGDLARIGEDGVSQPITDQCEPCRAYAGLIRNLQEDAEFARWQDIMRVGNAYRAIDRISVADMLSRRKHLIDMMV